MNPLLSIAPNCPGSTFVPAGTRPSSVLASIMVFWFVQLCSDDSPLHSFARFLGQLAAAAATAAAAAGDLGSTHHTSPLPEVESGPT